MVVHDGSCGADIPKATPHKSKIMPTTKEKHPTKKPSAQIISCFSSQGKQNQADRVVQSQILCKHQNRCKTESKYIVAAAALSDAAYLHNNTDGA